MVILIQIRNTCMKSSNNIIASNISDLPVTQPCCFFPVVLSSSLVDLHLFLGALDGRVHEHQLQVHAPEAHMYAVRKSLIEDLEIFGSQNMYDTYIIYDMI